MMTSVIVSLKPYSLITLCSQQSDVTAGEGNRRWYVRVGGRPRSYSWLSQAFDAVPSRRSRILVGGCISLW